MPGKKDDFFIAKGDIHTVYILIDKNYKPKTDLLNLIVSGLFSVMQNQVEFVDYVEMNEEQCYISFNVQKDWTFWSKQGFKYKFVEYNHAELIDIGGRLYKSQVDYAVVNNFNQKIAGLIIFPNLTKKIDKILAGTSK